MSPGAISTAPLQPRADHERMANHNGDAGTPPQPVETTADPAPAHIAGHEFQHPTVMPRPAAPKPESEEW
jgi:hypothetical protein